MQLGVLGDLRLNEEGGLLRVEAGDEPVGGDLNGVLGDLRSVGVIGRERVPIRDEVETFTRRVVLEFDAVLEGSEGAAGGEPPSRAHAADDAFAGGGGGSHSGGASRHGCSRALTRFTWGGGSCGCRARRGAPRQQTAGGNQWA